MNKKKKNLIIAPEAVYTFQKWYRKTDGEKFTYDEALAILEAKAIFEAKKGAQNEQEEFDCFM